MTFIASYINDQYAIVATDRRTNTTRAGKVSTKDAANKACLLGGRMLLAYTGLANMARDDTDRWVIGALSSIPEAEYIDQLYQRTERELRRIRSITPPEQRRMAYLIVGYQESIYRPGTLPVYSRLSNYWRSGTVLTTDAEMQLQVLSIAHPHQFVFEYDGTAAVDPEVRGSFERARIRLKDHTNEWKSVVTEILDLSREATARYPDYIGTGLSISVLPSIAVPTISTLTIPDGGRLPDKLTHHLNVFVPHGGGLDEATSYSPASVLGGTQTWGGKAWRGSLPPIKSVIGEELVEHAFFELNGQPAEMRLYKLSGRPPRAV